MKFEDKLQKLVAINDEYEIDDDLIYDNYEEVEEVIEIDEAELLLMMDKQEDPLYLVQRLFTQSPYNCPSLNFLKQDSIIQLFETGLTILENQISTSVIENIRLITIESKRNGNLTPAAEMNLDNDPFRDRSSRSDLVEIIYQDQIFNESLLSVIEILNSIKSDLSKVMHLNGDSEFQLALYPGNNTSYEMHRDSFPIDDPEDKSQRRVTIICYLNPLDWNSHMDGGNLKIHRSGIEQEIQPFGGRIVIFFSGVIDHEVLPASRDRLALTSWIK